MDMVLERSKSAFHLGILEHVSFGTQALKIRQNPNTHAIEMRQETYINSLDSVQTKKLGSSRAPVKHISLFRRYTGQLAWTTGSTKPDKAFLTS